MSTQEILDLVNACRRTAEDIARATTAEAMLAAQIADNEAYSDMCRAVVKVLGP